MNEAFTTDCGGRSVKQEPPRDRTNRNCATYFSGAIGYYKNQASPIGIFAIDRGVEVRRVLFPLPACSLRIVERFPAVP